MDPVITRSATDVLAAGSILTVTVTAGSGAYVTQMLNGLAVADTVTVTSAAAFGPFGADMVFRVDCIPGSAVTTTESQSPLPLARMSATGGVRVTADGQVAPLVASTEGHKTLAQLSAITPTLGLVYPVSDMGGALFRGNGSRWAPLGGRCAIPGSVTTQTANFSTGAETVQVAIALPPGMWANGDFIDVRFKAVKVGSSDTCAVLARFGTSPSTLGTSGQATTNLATTTQQLQAQWRFQRISATSISYAMGGAGVQATTTTAEPGAVTVPNLDTQTVYLQLTMNKTVNTATEVAYFNYATAELVSFP